MTTIDIMTTIKLLMILMFFISLALSFLFIIELIRFAKINQKEQPTKHEKEVKALSWVAIFLGVFWTIFYLHYLYVFTEFFPL